MTCREIVTLGLSRVYVHNLIKCECELTNLVPTSKATTASKRPRLDEDLEKEPSSSSYSARSTKRRDQVSHESLENRSGPPYRIDSRKFKEEGPAQVGLFAARDICANNEIVCIPHKNASLIKTSAEMANVLALLKKRKQPSDVVFHILGSSTLLGVYDKLLNVTNMANTDSFWYAQNHSKRPNVAAFFKRDDTGSIETIGFRATRNIVQDEELTFDYGEPNPDWED